MRTRDLPTDFGVTKGVTSGSFTAGHISLSGSPGTELSFSYGRTKRDNKSTGTVAAGLEKYGRLGSFSPFVNFGCAANSNTDDFPRLGMTLSPGVSYKIVNSTSCVVAAEIGIGFIYYFDDRLSKKTNDDLHGGLIFAFNKYKNTKILLDIGFEQNDNNRIGLFGFSILLN